MGLLIHIYGIGIGRYKWFPFQIIKTIQGGFSQCEDNPYSEACVKRIDIKRELIGSDERMFAISETKDIESQPILFRKKLLKKVIVPKELIKLSSKRIGDNKIQWTSNLYGIKSNAILSKSKTQSSSNCLNIYIQGHAGDPFKFDYHNRLLETSNEKGCDFLSFSMLGRGLNKGPVSFPSQFGKLTLNTIQAREHNNYAYFLDQRYTYLDPLALFLSPHYWIINNIQKDYKRISLMGISGGGWYAVLLSSLIPEIDTSISYAGSLPLSFRLYPIGWGQDWENNLSYVYREFSYWKLYALRTYDEKGDNNRRSYFVFNNNDSCCFRDPIVSQFKAIVDSMNKTNWSVIIDKNNFHTMNVELVNSILYEN
tara:strand:- start:6105 stop:7208 length:1104 start_codon:yes stop_codon:yes gene_type:complete